MGAVRQIKDTRTGEEWLVRAFPKPIGGREETRRAAILEATPLSCSRLSVQFFV
jgi:hypothetical protein